MPAIDLVDEDGNKSGTLGGVGDAAFVITKTGTGEISKNRNINVAATTYVQVTNTVTFTSADNVKHIVITPKGITAAADQNDEFCLVVFDAANEAAALAFLTDLGGIASTVSYEIIKIGQSRQFDFTSYLSRVDVLPLNNTMRVILEAQ